MYDFLIGVCGVVLGNNGLPCVDDGVDLGTGGVDPSFEVGFFGIFGILIPLFNDIFFFKYYI